MKVILTERVTALGNVGEIYNVSPGYARNYLFPKSLAVLADESNKKFLENQQRQLAKKVAEHKKEAEDLKSKLEGKTLNFLKRVAGNGKLFGTVSANDIVKELQKAGLEVEKRLITIPNPIKTMGKFDIVAKIFDGVEATFHAVVEMDLAQKKEQEEKQLAASKRKKAKAAAKAEGAEDEADATEETAETTDATEAKTEE
jgi:large subunit ribosomal protein L9